MGAYSYFNYLFVRGEGVEGLMRGGAGKGVVLGEE